MTHGLDTSRSVRRGRRGSYAAVQMQRRWLMFIFSVVFVFTALQWLFSFPPPLHNPQLGQSCTTSDDSPYVILDDAVCTNACGKICYPRVRGLCVAHDLVTVCSNSWNPSKKSQSLIPNHLRFQGSILQPRRRVPVKTGVCAGSGDARWINGTQLVADMKMMPAGPHVGPNPHHEAEKLIPAILLTHLSGLKTASLYWFANPDPGTISRWSLGLVEAFSSGMKVNFETVPDPYEPQICFQDAILLSGLTNGGYMPNVAANDWLRRRVLAHCKVPQMRIRKPLADVVVVQRLNSSRTIHNVDVIQEVLERELKVPVRRAISGVGSFCDQAKVTAGADFFLTPHGSHNINFLFARRDAIVLEAFPLLYYIDWFHNYVHAARVNHYELYGTWPTEEGGMPLRMRLYAVLVGWKYCFQVKHCMNYAKGQRIHIDIDQLESLLHVLVTTCRIAVRGSWCLNSATFDQL